MRWLMVSVAACSVPHAAPPGDASDTSPTPTPVIDAPDAATIAPDAPVPAQPTMVRLTVPHVNPASPFGVAYFDAGTPWRAAPPPDGDTFTVPIYSGRYGFAWFCEDRVELRYFTTAETTDIVGAPCGVAGGPTELVRGAFTFGSAPGQSAFIWWGTGGSVIQPPIFLNTYSIYGAPGTHDLVITTVGSTNPYTGPVIGVRVIRDVTLPPTSDTMDLDASGARPLVTFPAVVSPGFDDGSTFLHANGTRAYLGNYKSPYVAVALDPSQASPLDHYAEFTGATAEVVLQRGTVQPDAHTWPTTPPPLGAVTASLVSTSPILLDTSWSAYPNATGYRWSLLGNAPNVSWTVYLSAGTVGATPHFRMPDLAHALPALPQLTTTFVPARLQAIVTSGGADDFANHADEDPAPGVERAYVRHDWNVPHPP